jgi:acyl-CoA synthetase (AMP-forming)/AMP-acid ligase II
LIVAIAAVVKTGAVFVPISTWLSTDEVQFIFNDCQPQMVVFASAFRDAAWAAAANLDTVTFIVTGPAEDGETAIDRLIDDGDSAAPWPGHADRVPYICAIVELAEGCRMVTNLVNCEAGELKIGMDLKLAWDRLNDDFRFPVFEPA